MADQRPAASRAGDSFPGLDAMDQAWSTVAECLGTTATAALVRRAAKRGTARVAGLAGFHVEGAGYTYHFAVPDNWRSDPAGAEDGLRALLLELCALLSDLTGDVVISRLAAAPAVRPYLPPDLVRRNHRHASRT